MRSTWKAPRKVHRPHGAHFFNWVLGSGERLPAPVISGYLVGHGSLALALLGNYLASLNNDDLDEETAQNYVTAILDKGLDGGMLMDQYSAWSGSVYASDHGHTGSDAHLRRKKRDYSDNSISGDGCLRTACFRRL